MGSTTVSTAVTTTSAMFQACPLTTAMRATDSISRMRARTMESSFQPEPSEPARPQLHPRTAARVCAVAAAARLSPSLSFHEKASPIIPMASLATRSSACAEARPLSRAIQMRTPTLGLASLLTTLRHLRARPCSSLAVTPACHDRRRDRHRLHPMLYSAPARAFQVQNRRS